MQLGVVPCRPSPQLGHPGLGEDIRKPRILGDERTHAGVKIGVGMDVGHSLAMSEPRRPSIPLCNQRYRPGKRVGD